jgi:aryl-alcohol dehydrogenase-like predicted oxidoreductase
MVFRACLSAALPDPKERLRSLFCPCVLNVGETFAGLPFEYGVELADMIKGLLPNGMSMVQLALRWILDHDAVSVVIPGASSPEQAKENACISDLAPLPTVLHTKLSEFYQQQVHDYIRGPY